MSPTRILILWTAIFVAFVLVIVGASVWNEARDRRWVQEQLAERGMTDCVETADWQWVCDEGRSGMILAK